MSDKTTLVFDIETNGLIPELTTIHSLVIKDALTGELWNCTDEKPPGAGYYGIVEGIKVLMEADVIVGHNIQAFDIPAIQKLYPWFKPKGLIRDTIVMSRLIYADMRDADFRQFEKLNKLNKKWIEQKLFGRHSLESWGQRLGIWKGDYGKEKEAEGKLLGLKGADLTAFIWGTWSQEMQDYCVQDVEVTEKLWLKLTGKGFSEDSIQLEHDVRRIVTRQELYGFAFDERAAVELYGTLSQRKAELEEELQKVFPPWYRSVARIVPKADRNIKRPDLGEIKVLKFGKRGQPIKPYIGPPLERYSTDAPYTKIKMVAFNPGSRQDIADRLIKLFKWKPVEYTPDGHPKVDEEILLTLPFAPAKVLTEYLMIQKRIGQLAEGKEAWLKNVRNGRLHGSVNTNGAVTGRMTHSKPNMAQVPSSRAPYGHECRALFVASPGKKLVGCDADALELRDLAGYMAAYDSGAYIRTVLEGKKEEGTDMHTLNAKALGCSRDDAKTWFSKGTLGGNPSTTTL